MITRPVKLIEVTTSEQVIYKTLPDGSKIALNKNSKLIYPGDFRNNRREVRLIGEAFFEVTPDAMQPFIVDAGIAKIRVLGTSFRVNAFPDSAVEVNVIEGKVLFFRVNSKTGDTSSVILTSGKKGILGLKSDIPELEEKTAPDNLFWFNQSLEFRQTELSDVFDLIEKYYHVQITVTDKNIERCRLSASFINEPVERILQVIAESFNLKLIPVNQTYLFSGNGCPQ
jgi:ferric-dicitrate binding protein FerR (iron transport regulator)